MDYARWRKLMQAYGFGENRETFDALLKAYSEKHRRYHSKEHIVAILHHLDRAKDVASNAWDLELSLWFHDAVYKPISGKNEEDSANWACDFLNENIVLREENNLNKAAVVNEKSPGEDIVRNVRKLILATKHDVELDSSDEKLIVDIDLSILGSSPSIYEQYEKDIRFEYQFVPRFIYRKKRKEILNSFLRKSRIYSHDMFYEKFESQAKINLRQAIQSL